MRRSLIAFASLPLLGALAAASGCSSSSGGGTADAGSDTGTDANFPEGGTAEGGQDAAMEATPEAGPDASDASSCAPGQFTWATSGGGAGQYNQVRGVAVDKDGNTWVVGTFIGQATWGGIQLTSSDSVHAVPFFAKLDPTGKVLLARTLDAPMSNVSDPGARVRVDPQGNAYIVGTFEKSLTLDGVVLLQDDTEGGGAAFVIKVDPNGKALWGIASANQGGSDESGRDVAIDPSNGDVYLVGSYNGYAVFYNPGTPDDGGTPPAVVTTQASGGDEKAYIAKFSQQTMTWQWAKGWIGTNNDGGIAHGVVLDPGHSTVTVTGEISGEITIEGVNLPAGGGSFVATLAQSDGHLVWVTEIDPGTSNGASALTHAVTADAAGNLYVAGELNRPTTFWPASSFTADGGVPDAGAGLTVTPSGGDDAFVVKYDSNGNPTWAKHGGASNAITRADDVALDGQNGVYVAGFTQGAAFDGTTFTHVGNLFVARYDTSGALQWLTGSDDASDGGNAGASGEGWGIAVRSPMGGVTVGGGFGADPIWLGSVKATPVGVDTGLVTRLCN